MFIKFLSIDPNYYFTQIFIVIFSICCHEYAHAKVALCQGDDTAAREGHLTLNPLIQMKGFSLIMLALLGIAWGAVPVNPNNFKKKYSDALISFAGPLMNLLLFSIAIVLVVVVHHFNPEDTKLQKFMFQVASLNMVLFLFNMMPIPMLDGGKIFAYFIPALKNPNSELAKGLMIFAFFTIFSFSKYFWIYGNEISLYSANFLLGIIT